MALIKITEDSPAARLAGVNRDTLNNGDLSADVTSPKCKECLGTEEPQVDNTYNNYALAQSVCASTLTWNSPTTIMWVFPSSQNWSAVQVLTERLPPRS